MRQRRRACFFPLSSGGSPWRPRAGILLADGTALREALQTIATYDFMLADGRTLAQTACLGVFPVPLEPLLRSTAHPVQASAVKPGERVNATTMRQLQARTHLGCVLNVRLVHGWELEGTVVALNPYHLALQVADQQRIAFGERAGQKVRRIGSGFGAEGEQPTLSGARYASVHGFSLHANTQVPAHRRDQLERLIRYTARGAVSLERLAEDANGDLVYTVTKPWSDGTTGMRLSPLELREKLAALVPLPRVHLGRSGGCLAPHSSLRSAMTPTPRQQGVDEEETDTGSPRWSWARLLKRVFAVDMARCPWCQQGALRIIAAITQGEVIRKILRPLQRAADPPPIAPARLRQKAFA